MKKFWLLTYFKSGLREFGKNLDLQAEALLDDVTKYTECLTSRCYLWLNKQIICICCYKNKYHNELFWNFHFYDKNSCFSMESLMPPLHQNHTCWDFIQKPWVPLILYDSIHSHFRLNYFHFLQIIIQLHFNYFENRKPN